MDILIIEDEERNANRLIRLLKRIDPAFRIKGPLASIGEVISYLQTSTYPDLILADIRLSDGLSFEALKEAPTSVPIIFTTAYDEYAIQAFKYNSIDYLLKPIDTTELSEAIEKVRHKQNVYQEKNFKQLFEALQLHNYKYRERFLLPYYDGYKTVCTKDINHIFIENKIVRLFLNNGTSEAVSMSMDELEKQLNPSSFFRANRQFIVSIESILFLGNYFGGKLVLRLKGYPNTQIIISKDKAPLLKEWLDK